MGERSSVVSNATKIIQITKMRHEGTQVEDRVLGAEAALVLCHLVTVLIAKTLR